MSIDDTIDFATFISIIICLFGWVLILGSIPLYFINSPLSAVVAVVGIVIMCIGVLMAFIIEPVFRVVYRYLSKKD